MLWGTSKGLKTDLYTLAALAGGLAVPVLPLEVKRSKNLEVQGGRKHSLVLQAEAAKDDQLTHSKTSYESRHPNVCGS